MKEKTFTGLYSGATPEKVAESLAPLLDFQAKGVDSDMLKSILEDCLQPHLMLYDRPQFQSMFNAFPPSEAKMGAKIALNYNQGVTNWQVSPGGAMLEELCCQALCNLFSLGPESDATFMYSGTYGNQQALYFALHRHAERQGFNFAKQGLAGFSNPERLAVLVSSDTHFSLKHAVQILGLGEISLIPLTLDHNRRIDVDALGQVLRNIKNTRDVFCVVANAGTTSVGAIDPINSISDICQEISAWLHVDGAYGYAYKLIPEKAYLFEGDIQADSIVWDPHKQLGAPIPNSVLFVKQHRDFNRAALHTSYFNRPNETAPNPGLKSPPSTRPMSALSLVTLLRGQGIEKVIDSLRAPLKAISSLADVLTEQQNIEVLHKPETGILCFRMTPDGVPSKNLNNLQEYLYHQIRTVGERSISITNLDGITALRLVVVSPDTTFEDLWETIQVLLQITKQLSRSSTLMNG